MEKQQPELARLMQIRAQLKEDLQFDDAAYAQMLQVMEDNKALTERIALHYELYDRGQPVRPTLGNEMQIFYMRDRQTFMFLMFPEMRQMAYQLGRAIGAKFVAPYVRGTTLPECFESNMRIAGHHGYGYQEVVEVDETHGTYRTYECADCYGFPNIGMKICAYEAGTASGIYGTLLNRKVVCEETKCCANGDPYCEFEVRIVD
nr:V4R domain-containing protein [Maliibacterium massiliense]